MPPRSLPRSSGRNSGGIPLALVFLLALVIPAPVFAHETITTKLTWTREISRMVFKRCSACHRPGGQAPMAFLTYEETRPWAKAIQEEVSERRMPPWNAVKGFGPDIRHDASLTPEEIKLFNDWVEGGAPKGDDKYLPPAPAPSRAEPTPRAAPLSVRNGAILARDYLLIGIRPAGLAAQGELTATAEFPGGSIEPLIWIRKFDAKRNRTYWLAEPMPLPRGTRLRIQGPGQLALMVR